MKYNFLILLISILFIAGCAIMQSGTDKNLKCTQLYELKKNKYWEWEIGQSNAIFNWALNSCFAYNIYNNPNTHYYFAAVVNIETDEIRLYYSSEEPGFDTKTHKTCANNYQFFSYIQNNEKIIESWCDRLDLLDKMFSEIRKYGFVVFDWFKTK